MITNILRKKRIFAQEKCRTTSMDHLYCYCHRLGVIILIRYNRNRKAMIREQEKNFMRLTNNNIGKANYI